MRVVIQGALVVALATIVRAPSARVRAAVEEAAVPVAGEQSALEPALAAPRTDSVVLVVLDGARWQEVLVGTDPHFADGDDRGVAATRLMPTLHRMIDEGGVIGAIGHGPPMVATGPNFISLPGYTEIFSGRTPALCADNECPATRLPTLVDEIRARSSDVAVYSSWQPIARAAARNASDIVMSTGSDGTGAFRPDRATADLALAYLIERRPAFLFVGLGEPDEFAHRGDYAGYLGSLRQADEVLTELRERLSVMGEYGDHTSILVTCDHGRADDFQDHGAPWPESSRVWLVGAGGAIPARGEIDTSDKHRLADIAPTIRRLIGLSDDASPGAGEPIAELLPTP
jgi:Metalloenzyme superfamily